MLSALPADPAQPAAAVGPAPPLLVGPRARAGMANLVDRLLAVGRVARVFGHPARFPPNRDALVAAGVAPEAIVSCDDVAQATVSARGLAGEADRIAVFGSFVTVAAALRALEPTRRPGA